MGLLSHHHPVDPAGVGRAADTGVSVHESERLATLLTLLSDPVRLRILFALVEVDELCVGDLALALAVTLDQSSYALKQLRAARVVETRRSGRVIYYRLADGFPRQLLEHCLRQLLSLADAEAGP